ncbi:hypothetical protein C2S51_019652 [Perilla frutescens var. frutescens]|nr:hypothetical protein C2S51_019652 [Perilla frutescens var. frutescens]
MGQDFFTHLPSEMTINILSRLPARTAVQCKCVCKPWLNMLESPEFVKSHKSKAVPGLAVFEWETQSKPYKIVEFVEKLDLNIDEHRWKVVLNFNIPFNEPVHSSANGLLFLCKRGLRTGALILCNPITREYIKLPCPRETSSKPRLLLDTYGFGVSRMSGQYKLVRMFFESYQARPQGVTLDKFECQVYSVGTGSWRRIDSGSRLKYEESSVGAFVNGNLHWLAVDLKCRKLRISCFDLETELFSTFSPPPRFDSFKCRKLSVLGDCLCLCFNGVDEYTGGYEIVIWLMKEYGDERSWTKELVIWKMHSIDFLGHVYPIKVFEDGDILMEWESLLHYSNKTKTIREVNVSGLGCRVISSAVNYAPSFLPLNTFAMENVSSF